MCAACVARCGLCLVCLVGIVCGFGLVYRFVVGFVVCCVCVVVCVVCFVVACDVCCESCVLVLAQGGPARSQWRELWQFVCLGLFLNAGCFVCCVCVHL